MLNELKEEIAETIRLPKYLQTKVSDEAHTSIWTILNIIYTSCIDDELLSERMTTIYKIDISEEMLNLKDLTLPEDFLISTLWIEKTVRKWLDSCVNHEEFESAYNLKKLMDLDE